MWSAEENVVRRRDSQIVWSRNVWNANYVRRNAVMQRTSTCETQAKDESVEYRNNENKWYIWMNINEYSSKEHVTHCSDYIEDGMRYYASINFTLIYISQYWTGEHLSKYNQTASNVLHTTYMDLRQSEKRCSLMCARATSVRQITINGFMDTICVLLVNSLLFEMILRNFFCVFSTSFFDNLQQNIWKLFF